MVGVSDQHYSIQVSESGIQAYEAKAFSTVVDPRRPHSVLLFTPMLVILLLAAI